MSITRPRLLALICAGAVLGSAAPAAAISYPPPADPGKVKTRKGGKQLTFYVCKKGKVKKAKCFRSIQTAVDKALAGDTVKVADGTYKESVKILGAKKDGLRLIGNPSKPSKVVLDLKGLPKIKAQHGVIVNGADDVVVRGFQSRNYLANGFFAVNNDDYQFRNLIASGPTGVYGIYAFNTRGGVMRDSEAYYNNDAGFYIGQTKPQSKPKRSLVTNVKAWGNVIGFSGTNMRYVTITKSEWFNNGLGIVPNALSSEDYPPEEDNVITKNKLFWNNFNYFKGAPFKLRPPAKGLAYPVGVGVLLFGGRGNVVSDNEVFGNYLLGVGAVEQIILALDKDPALKAASILKNNKVTGNVFGKGGADLNGRDMFYDGTGSGNCFDGNSTQSQNVPADNSTFVPCTSPATPNAKNSAAQTEAVNWTVGPDAGANGTHEAFWIRSPHVARPGITPLERCTKVTGKTGAYCKGHPAP